MHFFLLIFIHLFYWTSPQFVNAQGNYLIWRKRQNDQPQIFPLDTIEDDDENVDELLDNEEDELDDDEEEEVMDGPNSQFWQQSIGPFLYTFEDANVQMIRQIWRPILENLNELRQQNLGPSSHKLVWDDQMARSVAQKGYSEMSPLIVPMLEPRNGLAPNLDLGIQLLFQAVLRRHIRCDKISKKCKGKRDRQFRFPIELVDSSARRIGCVARLFKNKGERRLLFGALCTTDRSIREAREKLILFGLNQLKNGNLRRELLRTAIDDFEENENENEEDDDELDIGNNVGNGGNGGVGAILRVNVEEGDILQAKVDVIVNPAKPSLSPGPQNGEEAIGQILTANSPFDMFPSVMDQRTMQRELKRLAKLIETENGINQKQNGKEAQRKAQKWQQMVANSANWAKMMDEAKRRQNVIGDGGQKMEINDRIIRAGGKVLTEKLAQLAEDKGGQLAIGDAVMTESFQIKENYFAKKIIHTVPPKTLQTQRDREKLRDCYKRTLKLAAGQGLEKIAFPEMMPLGSDESTRKDAIKIGLETIKTWKEKNEKNGGKKIIKSIVFRVQKDTEMLRYLQQQINAYFGGKIE